MNKIKILFLSALCLSSLYILSCASTIPDNKGDKNILVIPLNNEKQEGAIAFGTYALTINNKNTGEIIKKIRILSGDEYELVTNLPEGDYYIGSYFFIFTPSEEISDEEKGSYSPSFCSFSLRNGELTVTPICFGTTMTQEVGFRGKKKMILNVFEDSEEVHKQEVLEKLSHDFPEDFSTWKISE